ncbi:MAG: hypothetical protein GY762_20110 [Proteobacteria bacterium]|nr:hypothetical protein [Pseudomonadota bacterium]
MSNHAEIYCFEDSNYKGNIDVAIDLLRKHGYRVIVGDDVKELLLLLEIGDPAAIIYTLVSDNTSLEKSFQSIASKALERSLPMILIGSDVSRKGFTLYYPVDPFLDGKQIDSHMLASVLDEIHGTSNAVPWEASDSGPVLREKLVDSFEDGEESIRIETSVTTDEEPKITTLVYRRGEVIVREEQSVRADEPELKDKIESQHLAALSSYAPAPARPRRKYPDEVNGPIPLARTEPDTASETEPGIWGRKGVSKRLLVLGMLVFCGVVFYLSTRQVTPLPQPISRPEAVQSQSGVRAGGIGKMETMVREPDPFPDEAIPDSVQENDASTDDAVLFPGRFRPNRTVFGFRNKGEERIFLSTIEELSKEKKIRLVVPVVDSHGSVRKKKLAMARANAVFRYLRDQGIRNRDMIVGKSTDKKSTKQKQAGTVDLIIEQ